MSGDVCYPYAGMYVRAPRLATVSERGPAVSAVYGQS